MTYRHHLIMFALLCASSGCLSLDSIPLAERDAAATPEPEPEPDGSPTPGPIPPRDAGTSDAGPTDAGSIEAGPTDQLAACQSTQARTCFYQIESQHGAVEAQAQEGEYLYWIETGTTDTFQNYLSDGAIVRAKIGVWQREELRTGLNFWNASQRRIYDGFQIFARGDYVFWSWGYRNLSADYLSLSGGPHSATQNAIVRAELCAIQGAYQYCPHPDAYLMRRNLGTGEAFSAVEPTWPYETVLEHAGKLYGYIWRSDYYGNQPVLAALTPSAGDLTSFNLEGVENVLEFAPDGRIIAGLTDRRVGIGTRVGDDVVWKAISDPTGDAYLGSYGDYMYQLAVPYEWPYWVAGGDDVQVMRTNLSSGVRAEVTPHFKYGHASQQTLRNQRGTRSKSGLALPVSRNAQDAMDEAGFLIFLDATK